jgi:integrase
LRPRKKKDHKGGETASRKCPSCHSIRIWNGGRRKTKKGRVQRYECGDCGYRFSESLVLSTHLNNTSKRQVCAFETKDAKNLTEVEPLKSGLAGATKKASQKIDVFKEFPKSLQPKIVEYAVKRINQGCTEQGVKTYLYSLRTLKRNGADLHDPENVKAVVSRMTVSNRTKKNLVTVYDSFLKFLGETWQKPKYVYGQKLPYIPLESEIDQLIAGCSKTISTVLQTIKETGARIGEVSGIKWEDIDFKRNVLSINYPEKGSNPRQVKVSSKLIAMLNRLPRKRKTVFAKKKQLSHAFYQQRKRIANRLNNPQLRSIGLHTLRHWHATMEFHRTKNLLHVQQRLGHKNIKNTMIYTHLISFEGDEYHSATAETIDEVCKLVDAGFEYVCETNGVQVFRKRK